MDWKSFQQSLAELQQRLQIAWRGAARALEQRWRPVRQRLQDRLQSGWGSLRQRLPQEAPAWWPGAEVPPRVRAFVDTWHKGECWVAVITFGFIAVILVLDVIGRELVGPLLRFVGLNPGATGIFASQKLSIFALVIGSFAGIGIATATGAHIVPTFGSGWVPAQWKAAYDRAADVFTGLVLVAVAYYGFKFVGSSFKTGLRAPVLDWPVWPIQLAIPLGFLSAAGRYFLYAAWPALRPAPPEFQE